MSSMSDAVCQVAPEWWGAAEDNRARPDLAVWGCRVCPVTDCLERFAATVGYQNRPDDLANVTVAGMYGTRLYEAVNELATPRRRRRADCGTAAAYKAHLRRGETPCGGCREAHRDANERRGVRRAA